MTGSHQRVGNWPGVTVERKSGHFRHGDARFEVIDLPGIYSLLSVNATDAQDARIARDFLLDADIDVIVNVVDASSLARGLYLTSELLDLDIPVVVALNMMDVADRHGMHIDPVHARRPHRRPGRAVGRESPRGHRHAERRDRERASKRSDRLERDTQARHRADTGARNDARNASRANSPNTALRVIAASSRPRCSKATRRLPRESVASVSSPTRSPRPAKR